MRIDTGSPDIHQDQFLEIKCRLVEVAFLLIWHTCMYLYSVKPDKYYVESRRYCTEDDRHNSGESVFTSRGIPWELKYQEIYPDMFSARKRERWRESEKSPKDILRVDINISRGGKPG